MKSIASLKSPVALASSGFMRVTPSARGVRPRCTARITRSKAAASRTAKPPAVTTFDLKLMSV